MYIVSYEIWSFGPSQAFRISSVYLLSPFAERTDSSWDARTLKSRLESGYLSVRSSNVCLFFWTRNRIKTNVDQNSEAEDSVISDGPAIGKRKPELHVTVINPWKLGIYL